MITSQMSYEELANEVAKDYMDVSIIMRKKMPDALKYFRRQSKFPMFLFSTVTSPRKNKWILIFFYTQFIHCYIMSLLFPYIFCDCLII